MAQNPNDLPVPRSFNQILSDEIDAFLSRFGITSLKIGGPVLSFLEATSQSQLKSSQDIFNLLSATSLDDAQGIALDLIGLSEDIPRRTQTFASGFVTISDTSFTKISTAIFQATAAPIIGTTNLNVTDASAFPSSGSVYIGRGTEDFEGPIAYTSKTNNISYWTLNLSTGTLKFHNLAESVILAQGGNRNVNAGVICQTPQGNITQAVQFSVLYPVVVPDGETSINNVTVVCLVPGADGNVAAGAINAFVNPPFTGATATNPLPFTNGKNTEDNDTYRERIRAARKSKSKGTPTAIVNSVIGAIAQDENKTIQSSSLVSGDVTTLYIDDGTGYEEISEGIPIEPFIDSALGGEQFFKVSASRPVTKAEITTTVTAPFDLIAGGKLTFAVGGVETIHTFDTDEFETISNASAFEVAASINADSALAWSAKVSDSGNRVTVFAKVELNEDIELIDVTLPDIDANETLGFPAGRHDTMRLYKNDRLLNKDGTKATILSNPLSQWTGLTGTKTLQIAVDSTAAVTYTFADQDFTDGNTGYTSLGSNSLAAWAIVFNNKIAGITATVNNSSVALTSNRGTSSEAKLNIIGGSLIVSNMFSAQIVQGANKDYTLDRNTGEFKLTTALSLVDKLAAGSISTRAFIETPVIPTTTLSTDANLWFAVDAKAKIIPSGLTASSPLDISVYEVDYWGEIVTIASSTASNIFGNIKLGDLAVFWDPALTDLHGAYRVTTVDKGGTYFRINKKDLSVARSGHTETKLASGNILVTGGFSGVNKSVVTSFAEVYDPTAKTWTAVASMSTPRVYHTATLLSNNKVLVVGGQSSNSTSAALATAEIYDPIANTWSPAASLPGGQQRFYHTANRLSTNKILIAGGKNTTYLATSYLYDSGLDSWAASGSLATARALHTATVDSGGNVIATGGEGIGPVVLASTELYSIGGGIWSGAGNLPGGARQGHSAVLRNDNKVMVVGGCTVVESLNNAFSVAVDEWNGAWAAGPPLAFARARFALVKLTNGKVLAAYGLGVTNQTEVYSAGSWTTVTPAPNISNLYDLRGIEANTNQALLTGGFNMPTSAYIQSSAQAKIYDGAANIWILTNASSASSLLLPSAGISFVRTIQKLENILVPAAANYTSSTIVDQLNTSLLGALALTYQTNRLRIHTNTFDQAIGDMALVVRDLEGQLLDIPTSDSILNVSGHLGSVESSRSEIDLPDFHESWIHGSESQSEVLVEWSGMTPTSQPDVSGELVVLTDNPTIASATDYRYGNNAKFRSYITTIINNGTSADTSLRDSVETDWIPDGRGYYCAPYSIYYNDVLVTVADQNETNKRFTINMNRKIKSTGVVYTSQNEFVDADNSNSSIAKAFGINYNFDDFAVYMASRVKTHTADVTRRILWRYFRLGPDGNNARIRYIYAANASLGTTVTTDNQTDSFTNISVNLASGALKTGYLLTASHKIGTIATAKTGNYATVAYLLGMTITSATRTGGNSVTLTLDLASSGATNHGLIGGDVIYVKSTSGSFATGTVTLTSVTPSTVTYTEVGANVTVPNIGTVSFGPSEATLTGASPAVIVGDLFRIDSSANVDPNFENKTLRISSLPTAQTIIGHLEDFVPATSGTVSWNLLNDLPAFKIFANGNRTAAQIVSDINALVPTNPQIPVRPTLVGSGSGVISQSSADEAASSPVWFNLTDGINYVRTTINPVLITNNYQFVFKLPITSDLTSNSDWANEDVRLVPITVKNITGWLNTPAISGLFTACSSEASTNATKVQIHTLTAGSNGAIQVQGGSANTATATVEGSSVLVDSGTKFVSIVPNFAAANMFTGNWTEINNTISLPKDIIALNTRLVKTQVTPTVNHSTDFIFDSAAGSKPLWDYVTRNNNVLVHIEKQGKYVAINDIGPTAGGNPLNLVGVKEGDWLKISSCSVPSLIGTLTRTGGNTVTATTSRPHGLTVGEVFTLSPGEANFALGSKTVVSVADTTHFTYTEVGSNTSSTVTEYIITDVQIKDVNTGTFRVIRTVSPGLNGGGGTVFIENPHVLESSSSECDMQLLEFDSTLPGDRLTISTIAWGITNIGAAWNIKSIGIMSMLIAIGNLVRTGGSTVTVTTPQPHGLLVGDKFLLSPGEANFATGFKTVATVIDLTHFTYTEAGANVASSAIQYIDDKYRFSVDTSIKDVEIVSFSPYAILTASDVGLIHIVEAAPGRFNKQILSIAPNQVDPTFYDIKFTTSDQANRISENAGSIVTALGKLNFPTSISVGIDGYKHSVGLIGEANRILYGDQNDPVTYPGVVSIGSQVFQSGPIIRRIEVKILLRVKSGISLIDIAKSVKSEVASVINSSLIGQPIALSDIVTAAGSVGGVVAVTILFPEYDAGKNLIPLQSNEKALVLNLDTDILVSFTGDN